MYHQTFRFLRILLLVAVLLTGMGVIQAQGGSIAYGTPVTGTTDPYTDYTFSGTAGDFVIVHVTSLTPGLKPSIGVIGPNQMQYPSLPDPLNRDSMTAEITFRVPETGQYRIMVGSQFGTVGEFVLTLEKRAEISGNVTLVPGSPHTLDFQPGQTTPQVIEFLDTLDGPSTLSITTQSENFWFSAEIRNHIGTLEARFDYTQTIQMTFGTGPSNVHQVAIAPSAVKSSGQVTLLLTQAVSSEVNTTETCTNDAVFVTDVTIPDGTTVERGKTFTKTWRLRNTGTCTWSSSYTLSKTSGDSPIVQPGQLPQPVTRVPETLPGAEVDISIDLAVSPETFAGQTLTAYFQLHTPDGMAFGPTPYIQVVTK